MSDHRLLATRLVRRVTLLLALAVTAAGAAPLDGGLTWLAPEDGAVVGSAEVLVVFTAPPATPVAVQLDGAALRPTLVSVPGDDADLHHLRLTLEEGRHRVRILQPGTEAGLGDLTVTYVPPYSRRTATRPGDRSYRFHTREGEARCNACHNLPEVVGTTDRPLAPAGKVCGACHPSIEAPPALHGPVAVYACFMCHGTTYSPARFTQKNAQADTCNSCHEDFAARILGGKEYVHGPVAVGSCLVCHDPHGGRTQALVRDPPGDLCLTCHATTLPLPLADNLHGEISCTKCHDPHGNATPLLTSAAGNAFCGTCHVDVIRSSTGHPLPGHPLEGPVDPLRPGRPFGCHSCHQAHGTQDISATDLEEDETAARRFCSRCHY